jgi:amino acid transporter
MNNLSKDIKDRLKEIDIEEIIWIIYIGIIILSFYSNKLEKDYFINKNDNAKEKYRNILIIIFLILIFVYGYFLNDSFDSVKKLSNSDTKKRKLLTFSSYIGSLLIFISGLIFLLIAIFDEDIDVEIAFN